MCYNIKMHNCLKLIEYKSTVCAYYMLKCFAFLNKVHISPKETKQKVKL